MKNYLKNIGFVALVVIAFSACKKDEDAIDTTYPEIDLTIANASPVQCATLVRGEKFTFRAKFTDNVALGSYSLDVHHNFDQHNHTTEVNACAQDAKKTAVKPFLYIKDFSIPTDSKEYVATAEIDIPSDVDAGDYHFLIRLTDKEGWQTIKGVSIKIK
ncbi:DUF4625 domain-containing protein [Pedobacter namyangjuensis]|uniref:DUF4625 domain-containing protein n=1 Tax=Pedobacter namyangjuensis TaxID=600626 RepID=UPI000DE37DA4|nr:DUF4625 domain-containing protein [Pedobacter namyangjuensis]